MFSAAILGGLKAYTEYVVKQQLHALPMVYQQVKLGWLGELQITGIEFNQPNYSASLDSALIAQAYRSYIFADKLEFNLIGLELSITELASWLAAALKLDLHGHLQHQAQLWQVQLDLRGAGYELIAKLKLSGGDLTAWQHWQQIPIQNIELIYTDQGFIQELTAEQLSSGLSILRLLPLNTSQLAAIEQITQSPKQLSLSFSPPPPYPNYTDLIAQPLQFINYILLTSSQP